MSTYSAGSHISQKGDDTPIGRPRFSRASVKSLFSIGARKSLVPTEESNNYPQEAENYPVYDPENPKHSGVSLASAGDSLKPTTSRILNNWSLTLRSAASWLHAKPSELQDSPKSNKSKSSKKSVRFRSEISTIASHVEASAPIDIPTQVPPSLPRLEPSVPICLDPTNTVCTEDLNDASNVILCGTARPPAMSSGFNQSITRILNSRQRQASNVSISDISKYDQLPRSCGGPKTPIPGDCREDPFAKFSDNLDNQDRLVALQNTKLVVASDVCDPLPLYEARDFVFNDEVVQEQDKDVRDDVRATNAGDEAAYMAQVRFLPRTCTSKSSEGQAHASTGGFFVQALDRYEFDTYDADLEDSDREPSMGPRAFWQESRAKRDAGYKEAMSDSTPNLESTNAGDLAINDCCGNWPVSTLSESALSRALSDQKRSAVHMDYASPASSNKGVLAKIEDRVERGCCGIESTHSHTFEAETNSQEHRGPKAESRQPGMTAINPSCPTDVACETQIEDFLIGSDTSQVPPLAPTSELKYGVEALNRRSGWSIFYDSSTDDACAMEGQIIPTSNDNSELLRESGREQLTTSEQEASGADTAAELKTPENRGVTRVRKHEMGISLFTPSPPLPEVKELPGQSSTTFAFVDDSGDSDTEVTHSKGRVNDCDSSFYALLRSPSRLPGNVTISQPPAATKCGRHVVDHEVLQRGETGIDGWGLPVKWVNFVAPSAPGELGQVQPGSFSTSVVDVTAPRNERPRDFGGGRAASSERLSDCSESQAAVFTGWNTIFEVKNDQEAETWSDMEPEFYHQDGGDGVKTAKFYPLTTRPIEGKETTTPVFEIQADASRCHRFSTSQRSTRVSSSRSTVPTAPAKAPGLAGHTGRLGSSPTEPRFMAPRNRFDSETSESPLRLSPQQLPRTVVVLDQAMAMEPAEVLDKETVHKHDIDCMHMEDLEASNVGLKFEYWQDISTWYDRKDTMPWDAEKGTSKEDNL